MSGRNAQVSRIYCILNILEGAPSGLTVGQISLRIADRGHKASKRTVYRDLEALHDAGFPLYEKDETDEGAKRWVLDGAAKVNQYLVLSSRELFALYLSRGVLEPLRDTPFYEDIQSIFNKFEEKLGRKHQKYFEELTHEFKFEPGPKWGLGLDPDLLETVRAACAERQLLECHYSSVNSDSRTQRKLGPHYLYYSKGGIYLVAEDFKDRKIKVFAVPRISDAKLLDEVYSGEVITPEEMFGNAIGVFSSGIPEKVKIVFSKKVAPFVKERRWHSTQRVVSKSNGTIELTFEVAPTPELFQWILGFGPEAQVVSPEGVIEETSRLAAETAKVYGMKLVSRRKAA